ARAESSARAALARAPLSEDARIVLARAALEQNRLDEAEKEFRAALDSPLPSPATLAWGNIGLGEIALRRNRASDAAKRFDEAVRADAEYASTVAARAARIKAETAAAAPPIDEQLKAAVAQLDAAIRTGRKAEIDAAIVPGELSAFSRGLIGTQPEVWQTRVLRTQSFGPHLAEADVALTTRALGRDASGTGVFIFVRTPAGWKLLDRRFFELQ
ncbi:MAG TPA: tetratricopeptide repeat protein, partial [Pyrinomonadaceae bacterium]